MNVRSYRCESDDPNDSEHVDAVDEKTAALGYRALMLEDRGRAPEVVRVWCGPTCCNGCLVTVTFRRGATMQEWAMPPAPGGP